MLLGVQLVVGGYGPRAVPSPPCVLLFAAAATIARLSVRSWHRQSAVALEVIGCGVQCYSNYLYSVEF